jgi:uncharacterized protein (TIGR00290 family)
MSWALATAAGKDATLALHRARGEGLEVRWALNVFEGSTGLVRFHGTPRELVEAHARALSLEPLFGHTHPREFEAVFEDLLGELRGLGVHGIVFGNLHLADIRDWYETRVRRQGLEHREPLWGLSPRDAVDEFIGAGFRATVVAVNLEIGEPRWLGRELDGDLLEEFLAGGADPAGERGEYHTFVYDGPGFSSAVPFQASGTDEREGHRFLRLGLRG